MIDFKNSNIVKLKRSDNAFGSELTPMLTSDEKIVASYRAIRDGVVFTNKRIFVINFQGVTGKKRDITSLPYSKIQAFSIETSGVLDNDSELEIWISGLGKVRFEFTGNTNISLICKFISKYSLL